ncbi:unannotated protein [freshwater metagenome]|uniref:Unannotated protein n=1 Tax=freshwater metagenome TaxID=449393 RepID=A0A6J7FEB5_9ZZZZ|nr:hypothetical protein [Actinomycetota bacterium]
MTPRIRKAAALASTVVVLGGAGIGVASAADTTTSTTSTTSTSKTTRGDRGPGLRTAELTTIAKALGVTTAKLQAATDAARPAKPTGTRADRGADRAAEIAKALGVETAKVGTILEANRPAKPAGAQDGTRPAGGPGRGGPGPGGPRGGARPDDTKLIAALAKGLGIEEATVKTALSKVAAAHEAEHAERDTARYAAVAKSLGLEAADVRKAFEDARPARPTT